MNEILERIAKKYLSIKTLETRKNDDLDFYTVLVWSVKEALEQAYKAGLIEGNL